MKLKLMTILVVGFSMALFISLLLSYLTPMLLEEATELDRIDTLEDVKRVNNNILSNVDVLGIMTRDWAVWDDTYNYMIYKNEKYLQRNLDKITLENNQVDFYVFIDNQKQLVLQLGYSLEEKKPTELESDFYKTFLPLLTNQDRVSETRLVSTANGLAMTSLETIYQSNGEGPSVGTLIMGRLINDYSIKEMSDELSLNLSLKPIEVNKVEQQFNVENISETLLTGSLLLSDYSKDSVYQISFDHKRNFYLEEKKTVRQITIYLVAASLFFIILVIFLLNRFILSRVGNLSWQLNQIQENKDIKARVTQSKYFKDELFILESSINQMLSSLEEKHNETSHLAYYDQLTLLPNRYLFFTEFSRRTQHNKGELAILFLDLDGFKQVNDVYGHEIGDALLKEVARRILPIVMEYNGIAARYGGDEFMILLEDITSSNLEIIAQKILSEVKSGFHFSSIKTFVTGTIGISLYPKDGDTLELLLKNSDIAMYEAKRKGKNQYKFF
ncbi:diguanylate cyclase domain-containing protein [Ureibacillus sp. GCM10028918]|uniref:sensor domain-containing diguanylate cyclase n=1 Tax=Ureibacillus sp. GCM10028918 TaxID=3273429 RepID=UPI003618F80C